ncbi:NPCBM/NEW2 domain-containing protein [Isosphaeraceae bacterium EP7]
MRPPTEIDPAGVARASSHSVEVPPRRPVALRVAAALLACWLPQPAGVSAAPAEPTFTAIGVDGSHVGGRLRILSEAEGVTIVDEAGKDRVVPVDHLFKLERDGTPRPITSKEAIVVFPEGDRLNRVEIGTAGEASLIVQSTFLGQISVPLDAPIGLITNPPADPEGRQALINRVRADSRTSEVLWLANGDRLQGSLLGVGEKSLTFRGDAGQTEVARSGLVAIGFDPALVSYPRPEGVWWELSLNDGSRLGILGAEINDGVLKARTRFGATLAVPMSEVRRIAVRRPGIVYLSDIDPLKAQYIPYIGPVRPFRKDESVEGQPLRLGGLAFDRGLGTQSRTLLAYRLGPGDRRFQATLGVDDRAGPLGSVVFRILVDGKERFSSPPMSARDTPLNVDVELDGAKFLILATEFGDRGNVRDLADWVEARLIR